MLTLKPQALDPPKLEPTERDDAPPEIPPVPSINIEVDPNRPDTRNEERRIEVSILKDVIKSHRARGLLKYYGRSSPEDRTLAEVLAQAEGKRKKAARLDSIITEHGFRDMDEAQDALEDYLALKKRLADRRSQASD